MLGSPRKNSIHDSVGASVPANPYPGYTWLEMGALGPIDTWVYNSSFGWVGSRVHLSSAIWGGLAPSASPTFLSNSIAGDLSSFLVEEVSFGLTTSVAHSATNYFSFLITNFDYTNNTTQTLAAIDTKTLIAGRATVTAPVNTIVTKESFTALTTRVQSTGSPAALTFCVGISARRIR